MYGRSLIFIVISIFFNKIQNKIIYIYNVSMKYQYENVIFI